MTKKTAKEKMEMQLRNEKRSTINNELGVKLSRQMKRDAKAAIGLDANDESDDMASLILLAKAADPSRTWEELDAMGTFELFAIMYPAELVPTIEEVQALAEEAD